MVRRGRSGEAGGASGLGTPLSDGGALGPTVTVLGRLESGSGGRGVAALSPSCARSWSSGDLLPAVAVLVSMPENGFSRLGIPRSA